MKLQNYIDKLKEHNLLLSDKTTNEAKQRSVECFTCDTREISENALFLCKGVHFKKEYLENALSNGAFAYISSVSYGLENEIIVSHIRECMSLLSCFFYDYPTEKIFSVGITGTKGKSTTAYYLRNVLNLYLESIKKPECAIISSIDTYDGVERFESHITTPEPMELMKRFSNAVNSNISHLIMEVSSQGLKYGRVKGIDFDIAAFTNIGTDHISSVEHKDFEDYFTSKLKIFDCCKTAVINSESDYFDKIKSYAKERCSYITYGNKPTDDIYCDKIEKVGDKIFFNVKTPTYETEMYITMPGLFNVSNALCTVAICYLMNIPREFVKEGLKNARAAGRMQVYQSKDENIVVIVDYAHNKMSFDALFETVRIEYPGRKVVAVFGCPGKKAQLRRVDLAVSAGSHCDYVYITEEDSGEEPFVDIAKDIEKNLGDVPHFITEDRQEAIRKAIFDEPSGKKIILLTGKGEETRMKRGLEYIDFPSDVELTQKYLTEYDSAVLSVN